MRKNELELLLSLACKRQTELLDNEQWNSEEYKMLEHIKVRLKHRIKSKTKFKNK